MIIYKQFSFKRLIPPFLSILEVQNPTFLPFHVFFEKSSNYDTKFVYFLTKTFSCCYLSSIWLKKKVAHKKCESLKKSDFLKTIMIIACIAFIDWYCTIFSIFLLRYSLLLVNDLETFMTFYVVSAVIYQINFVVNPLIYILRLPNYRETFYLLCCKRETTTRRDEVLERHQQV